MKSKIVNFSEIANDPNLNLSAEHWCGEKRMQTKINKYGRFYRIGDEFIIRRTWSDMAIPCYITAINDSGTRIYVNNHSKSFSIETLREWGKKSLAQNEYYLTPKYKP